MLSTTKSYARIFRPWDENQKEVLKAAQTLPTIETTKKFKKKKIEQKRESHLRRVRSSFKKAEKNIHQDATVSTTTVDDDFKEESKREKLGTISPMTSLSICCNKFLEEPTKSEAKDITQNDTRLNSVPDDIFYQNNLPFQSIPHQSVYHSAYMNDYVPPIDITHALGVPTDPLLLESLAQSYALELEYARIIQQDNETKLLNSKKQRPKKYKCPHCQVGFSNNGQLKGHIRIHTGERPFKCDEKNCGKTFTRNEELTRHKRIHSGVRPFPCPTCGKKFGRRDHLKKHTRTHYLQAERMLPVFVPLSAMGNFPYMYSY